MSKTRMICSWCHETTTKKPCSHCDRDPELDGRWRLIESLGAGAAGQTWLAESTRDKRRVAIKELTYRRLADFKQLELFEREAKVLESLKHPGIPKYFEDFVVEEGRHVSFYLVQELIDGSVLGGRTPTDEKVVLEMMRELVDVLKYLASRRPPVIHRDIKPSNIMRRKDGSYVLIDFGTTRAAIDQTLGQSTVAGTLGYMAPEQLLGRATGASDVYGLAATAVALLAAKDASDLIDPHRPGQWRKDVEMSSGLADLLEQMLRVDVKDRQADLKAISKSIDNLLQGGGALVAKAKPARVAKKKPSRGAKNTALSVPADMPLLPPKKSQGESFREGLIEFSRNPLNVAVFSTIPLVAVTIYMGTWVITTFTYNYSGTYPGFMSVHLVWQIPLLAALLHVGAFLVGLVLDPERKKSVGALTRFRPMRKLILQFFRDIHIVGRVIMLIMMVAFLMAPCLGVLSMLGLDLRWGMTLPGLVLLDQIQAVVRGRTGWMRALGAEFDEVWPRGSEQRKAFVAMANKLWCNIPGWATKSDAVRYFQENYKAMKQLGHHPSIDSKQREHIDIILLTASYRPEELVEQVRSMEHRRATVEALKARIDYGTEDDDELTFELANAYFEHQLRAG